MPRVKSTPVTRRRRKKILKLAKGYFGSKRTIYRTAHEQVMRSLQYSYRDRKQRKREFRKLWISRINAAAVLNGLKYSTFIHGLALANVEVNRKVLADIAVFEPETFTAYAELAKNALANPSQAVKAVETKKAPAAKKEVKSEEVNYESLTVSALKELAKERGLSGYTTLKKNELVDLLKQA
ncbi:50S ribosomal protein L20 [Alteracholeplasma palmae J233]|uniref:Large ribosomal subunit protein bL20 n=1 Tax=Alteracholeplasma palmae (strain ATCC 49389 / J233) TaxID=1318466 RepID=U4KKX5_ALTPJ|nr:50S ribosomal protein L20 [Alteracholeplasma palmae J233]